MSNNCVFTSPKKTLFSMIYVYIPALLLASDFIFDRTLRFFKYNTKKMNAVLAVMVHSARKTIATTIQTSPFFSNFRT